VNDIIWRSGQRIERPGPPGSYSMVKTPAELILLWQALADAERELDKA